MAIQPLSELKYIFKKIMTLDFWIQIIFIAIIFFIVDQAIGWIATL